MSPTPLIYTYLKKYQEEPKSRVFAPLAEAYRKAGLVEEAISIAREGLVFHPSFVGGKVALARALFDKKRYEEVLEVMKPVVVDVPDNLAAQRLIAESSLMLGQLSDALNAFKMLLYFSPTDRELERTVKELEPQIYESGTLVVKADTSQSFETKPVTRAISEDPDLRRSRWMTRVQMLQTMLQRVERYRLTLRSASGT